MFYGGQDLDPKTGKM